MVYRSASGKAMGSSPPGSRVVDPTCYPSPSPSAQSPPPASAKAPQAGVAGAQPQPPPQMPPLRSSAVSPTRSGSYAFEPLPGFPRTLFVWENYDGAKALVAILLILATTYFLSGFLGFLLDHTPWLRSLGHSTTQILAPTSSGWHFWRPLANTMTHIASYVDLAFRLFVFLCAYCLAWATFDPRNIEGYVMGFFNTCLGLAYMFAPIDAIPDVIPIAGQLDDAVLGTGVLLLGLSSLYRNKLRDVKTKTILELIDTGNHQKALQMLLEDKGISVKDPTHPQ